MLLVIPTSSVLACGNSSQKEKTEKTACSKEFSHSEKKSCCDTGDNDGNGCNGTCDHASCYCPSSVNTFVFLYAIHIKFNNNFKLLENEWTYIQHAPKAIYLSIWQPPKIS